MNDTKKSRSTEPSLEEDAVVRDPYAVLGVSRDASYESIRRSYREKAKNCHPDLGAEPGREEEFKLLNWAHRVLSEQRRLSGRQAASASAAPSSPSAKTGSETAATGPAPTAEFLRAGRERLEQGAASEAESMARLALQRVRDDTNAYVLLAEALSAQARFAEAVGCLLMALQFDKDCLPAREALARLQERGNTR